MKTDKIPRKWGSTTSLDSHHSSRRISVSSYESRVRSRSSSVLSEWDQGSRSVISTLFYMSIFGSLAGCFLLFIILDTRPALRPFWPMPVVILAGGLFAAIVVAILYALKIRRRRQRELAPFRHNAPLQRKKSQVFVISKPNLLEESMRQQKTVRYAYSHESEV